MTLNARRAFDSAEYARRLADVRRRMDKSGFDLIVCQDPANMCWLTGFDGWSFYTPQAVVVHRDDEWPIWFGRAQDAKSAHITTDLPAGNIVGFSEPLVHHPVDHPFDELCDLIKGRGWGSSRIGVELDAHYYTARAHRHLAEGLPNATLSDNRELVNWARLVKSEAELVLMREAGQICTQTMNRAIARIAPGVPQHEVIAPLIQVGEGTSTPHLTWTDEPLPNDTLVMLEIGAARRHYHAPLTRTIHLGKPKPEIAKLAAVIIEGVDAALETIAKLAAVIIEGVDAALETATPGTTCEEVEAVWQKVLNRNGYSKESRVGYSIGLNFPPDWGERTASLRPGDTTVLEPGMCFHFQSGVWLEDYGAAVSEPFVVTTGGGERLCEVRRELIVID
jgi:Xaa-Pro aminopeptidase